MTPPPDPVAALALALTFAPEPFEVRRGVSAGGETMWGPPEPGSYTVQQRAESVMAMLHAAGWTLSHDSEREALDGWLKSAQGHLVDARSLHADNSDINAADRCIELARAAIERRP